MATAGGQGQPSEEAGKGHSTTTQITKPFHIVSLNRLSKTRHVSLKWGPFPLILF